MAVKQIVKSIFRRLGYEVINLRKPGGVPNFPQDFSEQDIALYVQVRPFTETSPERVYALARTVEYLVAASVPGSYVECGVWRGGSMMAAAQTLLRLDRHDIDLYLYDTYTGMPEPTTEDGQRVRERWEEGRRETHNAWNYADLADVRRNLRSTGYNEARLHFIQGRVEDTVPAQAPEQIALLRLDTDFYSSTRHELENLFPRLSPGGVLIVDDYGMFQGSRQATDEYIAHNRLKLLLNRIDCDARIAVKQ